MMKYIGIVFDLFGTLIDDVVGPQNAEVIMRMASVLSTPTDDFHRIIL